MRVKYCSLVEKIRLIIQVNRASADGAGRNDLPLHMRISVDRKGGVEISGDWKKPRSFNICDDSRLWKNDSKGV